MPDPPRNAPPLGDSGEPSENPRWTEIYDELHGLAESYFRSQPRGHTLQPTALVNEAYLKLSAKTRHFEDRTHFFRTAAKAMRQVLIDHARRRQLKKSYVEQQVEAGTLTPTDPIARAGELISLDESLKRFAEDFPRESEVVELRYFGGLTTEQTAEALGISVATVGRDWAFARAWLLAELGGDRESSPPP